MTDVAAAKAAEADGAAAGFGSCCNELKQALSAADFEPMITQGPDGVLYMVVGMIDLDKPEPGMVDHPLFFCPFCGTKLQTREDVKAKVERASAASAEAVDADPDDGRSEQPDREAAAPPI